MGFVVRQTLQHMATVREGGQRKNSHSMYSSALNIKTMVQLIFYEWNFCCQCSVETVFSRQLTLPLLLLWLTGIVASNMLPNRRPVINRGGCALLPDLVHF